jgi:hypothetical protein
MLWAAAKKSVQFFPLKDLNTEAAFKIDVLQFDSEGAIRLVRLPQTADLLGAVVLARICVLIEKSEISLDGVTTGNGKYASASCTASNMRFFFLLHRTNRSEGEYAFGLRVSASRVTEPRKRTWLLGTRAVNPSNEELLLWEQFQRTIRNALSELRVSSLTWAARQVTGKNKEPRKPGVLKL